MKLFRVTRLRLILLAILVPVFAGIFCFYVIVKDPANRKSVYYPVSERITQQLREGDIVLRRGYGAMSDAIASFPGNPGYTHCGILTGDSSGWRVIHSISSTTAPFDGVQSQDLQTFVNESKPGSFQVVRLRNSGEIGESIAELSKYYELQRKPFDHAFNSGDTTSFYCTEFIRRVIERATGWDVFLEKDGIYTDKLKEMSIFSDTSLFVRIVPFQ